MFVWRWRGRAHNKLISIMVAITIVLGGTLAVTVATAGVANASTTLCSGDSYATCTSAGYTDHGYNSNSGNSYWGADSGHNCTNYVAYVESTVNGASTPSYQLGYADSWGTNAQAHGVTVNGTPAVGAVAWWNQISGENNDMGDLGHVAYVESVSGNPGSYTITVSEDAADSGPFDWRAISQSDLRWPTAFIHFKDLPADGSNNDLHLSTTGTNGAVYELDQTSPGTWSPNWTTIGGEVLSTSITTTPDGLLHIAALGTNGDIYITDQQSNGQWSGWSEVSAQVTQVALAATTDGKLHIAALGTNGAVYELDQTSPGTWSPNWTTIGGNVTSISLTVTPQDEKLHIASVGTDGNIYIVDQSASTGLWGSWNQVVAQVTQVAIAATPEGKLHIASVGTNGSVYELDQISAGGAWSANWTTITADVVSVAMVSTSDGKLHIASKGTDGNIYIVDQSASTGTWGSWNEVSAQVEQVAIGAT